MAVARHRAEALFSMDPDERLAYMESPEWGFSADHLRQVNHVMDAFLDVGARREVRRLGGPVSGGGRVGAPRLSRLKIRKAQPRT